MSRNEIWHGRIVILGILLNLAFALPLLLAPRWILNLFDLPLDELIWARFAGLLLIIISAFYVPAVINIRQFRLIAWLAVFPSRMFGATFFFIAVFIFGEPNGFIAAIILDGLIGFTTLALLIKITREEKHGGTSVHLFDRTETQLN